MKRFFLLLAVLITLTLFIACKGDDGSVYFGLSWYDAMDYIYLDDPNIPSTIYNETYYSTKPGTYYIMWSYTSDSYYYELDYTIKADKGEIFSDGLDRYFLLSLYYDGDYEYTYSERYLGSDNELLEHFKEFSEKMRANDKGGQSNIVLADNPLNIEGMEKIYLLSYSETKGGYTITATYSIIVPKK